MATKNRKTSRRLKIKNRIRQTVKGTEARPRLSVFRSNREIYAQIINDEKGVTLVSASSLVDLKGAEKVNKVEQAISDNTVFIANHHDGRKTEGTTTLGDFGHSLNAH